jgi:hypothetical protein
VVRINGLITSHIIDTFHPQLPQNNRGAVL